MYGLTKGIGRAIPLILANESRSKALSFLFFKIPFPVNELADPAEGDLNLEIFFLKEPEPLNI